MNSILDINVVPVTFTTGENRTQTEKYLIFHYNGDGDVGNKVLQEMQGSVSDIKTLLVQNWQKRGFGGRVKDQDKGDDLEFMELNNFAITFNSIVQMKFISEQPPGHSASLFIRAVYSLYSTDNTWNLRKFLEQFHIRIQKKNVDVIIHMHGQLD